MDKIIQWFEKEKLDSNLQRIHDFWDGKERCMVTIQSPHEEYRQMANPDEMIEKAVSNLKYQATLPGVNIPTFIADFGTVTTAAYWGGKPYRDSTGENIAIKPVAETIEEAIDMNPMAVDNPEMDAAKSIRLFETLCQKLETEHLWLRAGDLQGTLNTAGLVMTQEQLLMALYSEPASVHIFLDKVCCFLIDYVNYVRNAANGKIGGTIWPYIFLPQELGFCMTEDLMPLLSPEIYAEFGIPYVQRMTDALGPVQIHCCGQWGRHAKHLADSAINIRSMEYHHPFTKIEELEPLADEGVVFVPYLNMDYAGDEFETDADYYRYLLEHTDEKYRYWFAFIEDSPQALEFATEHGF